MTREQTEAFLRAYLRAVEDGATGEALARFYTHDAVLIEHPNQLNRSVEVRRDLPQILDAALKGQSIIATQRNDVQSILIEGDHAALTLLWTGTFKVELPGLKVGDAMRARFAQFYTLRDGKIARQETFDCFEA